jgi:hypothetical protein
LLVRLPDRCPTICGLSGSVICNFLMMIGKWWTLFHCWQFTYWLLLFSLTLSRLFKRLRFKSNLWRFLRWWPMDASIKFNTCVLLPWDSRRNLWDWFSRIQTFLFFKSNCRCQFRDTRFWLYKLLRVLMRLFENLLSGMSSLKEPVLNF